MWRWIYCLLKIVLVNKIYNSFNVERFILTTNGSGYEEIVEKMSKYPIKYYVSIDGPETINDILREMEAVKEQ